LFPFAIACCFSLFPRCYRALFFAVILARWLSKSQGFCGREKVSALYFSGIISKISELRHH
jgi:hypothetical protein